MAGGKAIDAALKKRWSDAALAAYVGETGAAYLAYAADDAVRAEAASGGAVSAMLLDLLASGAVDGAVVCRSVIEDGRVRARYSIATTAEQVLAARGSTYVLGDFAGEALPLIRAFPGKLAVVALPCEVTLVRHAAAADDALAAKVVCVIGLLCGHATEPELIDAVTERLTREAGSPLKSYRFRVGHWRGNLRATFEDGTVIEKPSGAYNLYQNLYFHSAKKCLFCGDHFAYEADISVGDVWIYRLKDDPIKRSGVIVRTEAGQAALDGAAERGALVLEPVALSEIVDGQARVAPTHYNVSARAKVGRSFGMKIPDRLGERVTWHERLVARMIIANHRFSHGEHGGLLMKLPRPLLKAYLYVLKGLESLPVRHGEGAPPGVRRFAIIAGTLTGNHGAEAMLTTAIGQLRDRYPGARFEVFSYYPEADRALVTDPTISVHSSTPKSLVLVLAPFALLLGGLKVVGLGGLRGLFPRSVRALERCDALLDVAGVSFIDGREKFLPFNLLTVWPPFGVPVPASKVPQAMGPSSHPPNRVAADWRRHCALVFARGAGTWDNLVEFGMPEGRLRRAADVAFLHRDADSITHEGAVDVTGMLAALDDRTNARPVVGVCPSSVIAGKAAEEGWDYAGFLADIVGGLVADGCDVLLFPNATRAASAKPRNNDLPVIAEVAARCARLGEGRVTSVDFDVDTTGIKRLVARCDVAMVSRFHAMVGALTLAVPVFVLGWSHKYLEVMEQFGLADLVFDSSRHDPAEVLAAVRALRARRDEVAAAIAANLDEVRASSASQFDAVREVVGE